MRWSYKTVHFEFKKEGLLGGAFLDEAEIEEQLNDYGRSGWELISVIEVQDGVIAFFKQLISRVLSVQSPMQNDQEPSDAYAEEEDEFEPVERHDRVYRALETDWQEADPGDHTPSETIAEEDRRESAAAGDMVDDDPYLEVDDDSPTDHQGLEEFEQTDDDDPAEKSIGAIRIE